MRYAATLTVLGAALVMMGVRLSLWGTILIWLGVDFALLGIAHFRGAHGLFGKRSDGTFPVSSWLLFLPLLIYTAGVWHLIRLLSREPRINRVSDYLVVGRRLLAHEHPGKFTNYIDLTAESEEPRPLRQEDGYLAFPILDASAPTPEALRKAVLRLRPGSTFVHCAQGHGRTGLFAMAVMLSSGAVRNVEEGLVLLSNARPAIRLSPAQENCIKAYVQLSPSVLSATIAASATDFSPLSSPGRRI